MIPAANSANTWPANRAAEALDALARRSGLRPKAGTVSTPAAVDPDPTRLGRWIEASAAALGLDAEPEEVRYADVEKFLKAAAPALLRLSDGSLLALLASGTILTPDFREHRIGMPAVQAELCRSEEEPLIDELNGLLESVKIRRGRWERVRATLLRQRLAGKLVAHAWLLRTDPGANFLSAMRLSQLPQRILLLTGTHLLQYALWLTAWWVVGSGALSGRLDGTLLLGWVLLLLTLIPLRGLITWMQGLVAITGGGLLKERLLAGALRLLPEEVRTEGAGQLLGRVLESEALEALALSGGFLALVAVVEFILAAVVLAAGAGGFWQVSVLILWIALTALLGVRYFREQKRWTESRLGMTLTLVESMTGHRTRLAQEPREQWHLAEDQQLESYQSISRAADRQAAILTSAIPRGWLIVGVAALAPAFLAGASPEAMALGVAGLLLAYSAFRRLAGGLWSLTEAAIAAQQVAPLFHAAARPEAPGSPALALDTTSPHDTFIEASDITFRYRPMGEPVLHHCTLRIGPGDHILLEGPSGGGKSTFASILSGMLRPQSGLLLARGLDRQTLGGKAWRRAVAAAPQFHENHVLTGTFAFNLMMGREGWITQKDHAEAQAVCEELGLGPLLEKMPAGMLQMVGETGWQLSHGERSRLYIARALMQNADVLIFDESFAALDPENIRRALECVLRRARSVLVIAHP
jgi:ATP-binding cassette, subfamily B, bacterial